MEVEPLPDESLMTRVVEGHRDSFVLLVRRHAGPLLAFIRRMIDDLHHAEELVQDTFVSMWTNRGTYQSPRPLKPWMYAIALNGCRAVLRKQHEAIWVVAEHDVPADPLLSPVEVAIGSEMSRLMDRAIDQLPAQQRATVLLRFWEQLSYAEIAEAMECAEATVRSRPRSPM